MQRNGGVIEFAEQPYAKEARLKFRRNNPALWVDGAISAHIWESRTPGSKL
jgi:hypothetical protein